MQARRIVGKIAAALLHRFGYGFHKLVPEATCDIWLYSDIYGEAAARERRFYNIGSGTFYHPAWTNIDFVNPWYRSVQAHVDIDLDLESLRPIPVEDCRAKVVYSSHTVEHITDRAAQHMFSEAFRILEKGGLIRVTTPNIELYLRAYRNNDVHLFRYLDAPYYHDNCDRFALNMPPAAASMEQKTLYSFAAQLSTMHKDGASEQVTDADFRALFDTMAQEKALDYLTSRCSLDIQRKYAGNHINWWNAEKLSRMLGVAGFENVYLSAYGQSCSAVLRDTNLFDNHAEISLYVEATK